jgi:hypothetical protein
MVKIADTAMVLLDIIKELVEERSKWSFWHVGEYIEELVEDGYCVVERNAFSGQFI